MDKKILIGFILFIIFIFAGGILLTGSSNTTTSKSVPATYSVTDKEKPIVQTDSRSFDMGKMKVSQQKQKDFTIKNVGKKSLQLSGFSSSCGCTAGKIIYNGKEGPEFSMHSQNNEIIDIAPNTSATVRLIYRPFNMPVYGQVERELYISTNDPQNQKLTFSINAYVE